MSIKQMKALGFVCLLAMESLRGLTGENSANLRYILRSLVPFEDIKISGVKPHE